MDSVRELSHCCRLSLGRPTAPVVTLRPILAVESPHLLSGLLFEQPELMSPFVTELVVLKIAECMARHRQGIRLDRPFEGTETNLG